MPELSKYEVSKLEQKLNRAACYTITQEKLIEVLNSVKDDVQEQISIAAEELIEMHGYESDKKTCQELIEKLQAKINEIFK